MVDQVVAGGPVWDLQFQPVAALARAAVHFQHVRLDVMREVVGSVMFQRGIDRTFGGGIVAGLFVCEGPDALQHVVPWQVR